MFTRSVAGAAIASLGLFAAPREARADGLPRLGVHRGDGALDCPDAASLAAAVDAKMKHRALDAAPGDGELAFDVRIDRGPRGYEAVVQAGGRLRAIDDSGSSCAGLGEALAITLAILLDEDVPHPPPPPPQALPLPPPPIPIPVIPARVVTVSPTRLAVVVRGVVSDGLQEPGALGFDVTARLRLDDRFAVEAGVLTLPEKTQSVLDTKQAQIGLAEVSLTAASLGLCARVIGEQPGLHASVCADALAGTLTGTGEDFALDDKTSVRPWGAAAVGFGLDTPSFGPLGASLRVSGVAPFSQESFVVDGDPHGPAFKAARVGALASLGLSVSIW